MTEQSVWDRRTLVRTSGAVLGSIGLAGCGSESTGSNSTPVTTTAGATDGDADLRAELGLEIPDYEYADRLNVYQWENYWHESAVSDFEDAYGVDVSVDAYRTNEELQNTLESKGLDTYDIVFPSDWMLTRLATEEMLRPLDLSKIPDWENLSQQWIDQAPYDPGQERYSAPFQWATTGIGWNDDVIAPSGGSIDSWDAMWNDEWAGLITMLNNKRETIGASLIRLGYSPNTQNQSEIQDATEALIQQTDLVTDYDSATLISTLADGSASPVHTWAGEAIKAYNQTLESGSSPVRYTIPDEGSIVWVDVAAIPAQAPHPNTAHLFINYFLNDRVNALITTYNQYATPNEAAKDHLDESFLNNELVFPPEEICEDLEFLQDVGDAEQLYADAWDRIKNA